ncbi:hypothetical protein AVEN_169407-1 [Araneus ventricosus]|uniref:Uncharacterized protein n=1 Tax=Araneus ventricosus TaxID=182803 RepID=A0A4Y2JC54_ARAVE|nr:hypothetical protein AVEN_169407-1 [Araneus ventricosus]
MTRTTPELAPPISKLPRQPNGRTFGHYVWFSVQQAPYTADLQCNQVSNVEPFGPKADALPVGHRGPFKRIQASVSAYLRILHGRE